jgi:uncharacterized protein YyaL (SSP411 family)
VPNRLIHESSPYLRQHAHNPVDWYPWGPEALERARREDKPILLSVGYSACHWCHVMERESFENEQTARLMNEHFVSIKVDREERPDLDAIYMDAVQAMTGQGGWPMTVFLMPDGRPFYGGTYFPPEDRHGLPAFPRLLASLGAAYRERRPEIEQSGDRLRDYLRQATTVRPRPGLADLAVVDQAALRLVGQFDPAHGGIGRAPKFPQPALLDFLLRAYVRLRNPVLLAPVEMTLTRMARGGIYDQLGGGFHRYAVDAQWLVPHFEKMLYDNAQLASVYLHAYQVTGNAEYRVVVEETLDYVRREMTAPEGGFYAAQDADSEGEEGRFFVWDWSELQTLPGEGARVAAAYYGASPGGNFEGHNILHRQHADSEVAVALGLPPEVLHEQVAALRARLFAARSQRVHPGRDDKVLAGWNGLMVRAMAEAARVLGQDAYRAAAERAGDFALTHLVHEGELQRVYKDGRAHGPAFLEDYAFLADGFLALYEATFQPRWLEASRTFAERIVARFHDADSGLFFDTPVGHEPLIARPRRLTDEAIPAGGSVAVDVLLRLSVLFGEDSLRDLAGRALAGLSSMLAEHPTAFGRALGALEFFAAPHREVALVGEPSAADTRELAAVVARAFRPDVVVALRAPAGSPALPLLEGREALAGRATAYVCRNYACDRPTSDAGELAQQLGDAVPGLGGIH